MGQTGIDHALPDPVACLTMHYPVFETESDGLSGGVACQLSVVCSYILTEDILPQCIYWPGL